MHIKNLDPPKHPIHLEYEALSKYKNYPLPFGFKIVAWFITAACIVASSVILVMYGISFGAMKAYLWFTAFLLSLVLSLFIITPLRMVVLAAIKTIIMKKTPQIIKRKLPIHFLSNPENEMRKKQVMYFRRHYATLYKPPTKFHIRTRVDDVKYNLELRNLAINFALYLCFALTTALIVLFSRSTTFYFTNDVITQAFVGGNFTNTISFLDVYNYETCLDYDVYNVYIYSDVYNYETLFKYFSETLLPSLFPPKAQNSCKEYLNLERRNLDCAPDLNLFNEEKRDFSLKWGPPPPKGLTDSQISPWKYQSSSETASVPTFGKFSLYFSGGYILELARSYNDSDIILKYMDTFQWIDLKTRAVFIEFTLYCVNTNLFSVVTIIAEAPSSGYIIPSYDVHTCQLLVMDDETELFCMILLGLFVLTLTILMLREALKVHRNSFKFYIRSPSTTLDLGLILLGIISIIFDFLRIEYVSYLVKELEEADNNVFVSFYYAALWDSVSIYIDAILVCMAPFKLFQLLTFRVNFFQIQYILNQCYKLFFYLYSQEIILVIGFTFFFYMTLVMSSEKYSSFGNTLSTTIGYSAGLADELDFSVFFNCSFFLVPVVFVLFLVSITICFFNVFIAVGCLYFKKIRNTTFLEKYNLSEYVKYCLTLRSQKDILHMQNVGIDEEASSTVMRLKGGGNVIARKRCCKVSRKEAKTVKVLLKDLVKEKRCDLITYLDLRNDRIEALKKMMLILISPNENVKKDDSLLALYYSYITDKRKLYFRSGEYFFAEGDGEPEIFERGIFSKMRRVVEDFGWEMDLLEDDDINDEINSCEAKLDLLHDKINCLLKKLGVK